MGLNTIKTAGQWDGVAADLNNNFASITAELEKLKASNVKFKGYYTSELTLKSAYPSPSVGDNAWVGDTYPGTVYECKTSGAWSNTTKAPDIPSVQLADYAKKELVDSRTTEYNVSVQHPTSGTGGTDRYTLETAISQVPPELRNIGLKVSFVNSEGKVETWEFQGGTVASNTEWIKNKNWEQIPTQQQFLKIEIENESKYGLCFLEEIINESGNVESKYTFTEGFFYILIADCSQATNFTEGYSISASEYIEGYQRVLLRISAIGDRKPKVIKFTAKRSGTHLYLQSFGNTITWRLYKLPQEITDLQNQITQESARTDNTIKGLESSTSENKLILNVLKSDQSHFDVHIPNVTRDRAGVMNSSDKRTLDDIAGYEELMVVLPTFNMKAGQSMLNNPKFEPGKKYRFIIKCVSGRIDTSESIRIHYFPEDRVIWDHRLDSSDKIGSEPYIVDFIFPYEATLFISSAYVSVWSLEAYEVIYHESSISSFLNFKSENIEMLDNIKYNQPSDLNLEIEGKYYIPSDVHEGTPTGHDAAWGISKKYEIPNGCNYIRGNCGLHYTEIVIAIFNSEEKLIQLVKKVKDSFDNRFGMFYSDLADEAKYYAIQYSFKSIQEFFDIDFCVKKLANIGEQVLKNKNDIIPHPAYATFIRNLKVLCIGDSLTDGDHGGGLKLHYTSYPFYLKKYMGWNVTNVGASGATVKSYVTNKYPSIDFSKDYNVIIIMLGTNAGLTDTIEEDTSSNDYNTYADTNTGYYCRLIEMIYRDSPSSQIFLCIPPPFNGSGAYSDTVASTKAIVPKIAEKYNLPIIDVYHNLGINSKNYKLYQPIDGLHLNSKGYDRLAQLIGNSVVSKLSFQIETISEF